MFRIPKLSAPLTKFVRTTEGLLVLFSNVALVLVPIITNSLSAKDAATLGVILNGSTVIARSLLKGIAALNVAGLPVPHAPAGHLVDRPVAPPGSEDRNLERLVGSGRALGQARLP